MYPNTVRYRLRRMDAITHLATDHPDQRLAMIVALAPLLGSVARAVLHHAHRPVLVVPSLPT